MRSGWLCWRWRWSGGGGGAHPGRKGRRKGSLSVSRALSGCPQISGPRNVSGSGFDPANFQVLIYNYY
ncbi:unnamed protein product [Sphagnum jensenii]|uniref:Uncharacterized protein n=1 Tax=Sphagnum jensenii TaxID=128206 RepID=A0ABP0X9C3_9BRYO